MELNDTGNYRSQVLLSFQRALWEMVTPDLRGVAVTPGYPAISARFLYAIVPSDVEREIVAEVEGYVAADFDESVQVAFEALHVPPPMRLGILEGEWWVYLRRETRPKAFPE